MSMNATVSDAAAMAADPTSSMSMESTREKATVRFIADAPTPQWLLELKERAKSGDRPRDRRMAAGSAISLRTSTQRAVFSRPRSGCCRTWRKATCEDFRF